MVPSSVVIVVCYWSCRSCC